ncbi:phosphotransferase family protein [Streptomyces sp. NPDC088785]|uniref:phosphotransferase family protein n=1 Tax=Streptomyces sp. NPDC088785 TaxID=3365897 RepID=UPI003804D77B
MDRAADVVRRALPALPAEPLAVDAVVSRGYTYAEHAVARLRDGRSAFVKLAVDDTTASWLRAEYAIYSALDGPWRPDVLGWHDDGSLPVLVLEDLSGAPCPPPWTAERVDAVLAALAEVSAHPVPPGLAPIDDNAFHRSGWPEVARAPEPFLALGMCSSAWLSRALPTLLSVGDPAALAGDALLHLDVRSDNLFFRGDRAVLVDWNLAAYGNPAMDVAFWLPSLHMEGGPEPEKVREVEPALVALVAGFFAGRAGLPHIPVAPQVRDVQRRQLEVALPWAARVLDLPAPAPVTGI